MKKAIAIFIIALFLIANWWVGYSIVPSFWFGVLWILAAAVFGSIGGLIGIFIMSAFEKKHMTETKTYKIRIKEYVGK